MYVYIIGTSLATIFAAISENLKRGQDYYSRTGYIHSQMLSCIFAILSVLPLAIISAIRYNVGSDFFTYRTIFLYNDIQRTDIEIGNKILIFFINCLSKNPQCFFAVTSFLICIGFFLAIYKCSKSPTYSILLFVFTQEYFRSMNGIRQLLAAAIAIQALKYIQTKNFKMVILFVALSSLFHVSSLIIVFFYILCIMKLRPIHFIIFIGFEMMFMDAIKTVLVRLAQLGYLGSYKDYFTNSYSQSRFNVLSITIYVAFFIICIYLYDIEKIENSKTLNIVTTATFLAITLFLSRIVLPTTVTRLAWYMDEVLIIYSPALFDMISYKKLRYFIKWSALICYAIVFFVVAPRSHGALPYHTYW